MTTRKHKVPLLAALASVALIGLILLQTYLLSIAYSLKEQAFNMTVSAALMDASLRMRGYETMKQVLRVRENGLKAGRTVMVTQGLTAMCDSAGADVISTSDTVHTRPRHTVEQRFIEYRSDSMPVVHVTMNGARPGDTVSTVVAVARGTGFSFRTLTADTARALFVSTVMDNLREIDRRPIEQRVDSAKLDSVLRLSFRQAGVGLQLAWGVTKQAKDTVRTDTVAVSSPPGYEEELVRSNFGMTYDLSGIPNVRERLAVYFPGRKVYLLSQIWPALGASVAFIVLLALLFAYTIRTIYRQELLAASMVDFVNTMTHEFKTPLSTVTLATEAISRPDVVGRKTKVLQYTRMIADEADRMKLHADRILQLAQLETGELALRRSPLMLHALIATICDAFLVQVESRGGTLTTVWNADNDLINGDPVHLGNVLRSLLDNANKYSPDAPRLEVHTRRLDSLFMIDIIDNGTGIPPEFLNKVFDKFFRVPKGNVHDVKGFGIGLSYVQLIVEAHGGSVALRSAVGKGTTVTLSLPLLEPPAPGG
jgi:signal transduction histidine kinase